MPIPTQAEVKAYLDAADLTGGWADATIGEALDAETAAQAKRCKVPAAADPWPSDLADALKRRVAHNLALRPLPLGLQASLSESAVVTTRVGGLDAEVRRLEAPYRRVVVG